MGSAHVIAAALGGLGPALWEVSDLAHSISMCCCRSRHDDSDNYSKTKEDRLHDG